jgi:DNA-3-methyladenine glycosylase II
MERQLITSKRRVLTPAIIDLALDELGKRDKDLATIIDRWGKPPLWQRDPGFSTLIRIIIEQQVSLAAAKAVYDRLCDRVDCLTPENFLSLDDLQLKQIGFSRQKILYCRELATAIVTKKLDLDELPNLEDIVIKTKLKEIKGIGDWTVNNYLLMALKRSDVFPKGDLALAIAIQKIKNLSLRPKPEQLELISDRWRPWRAVATRILWHYYLKSK